MYKTQTDDAETKYCLDEGDEGKMSEEMIQERRDIMDARPSLEMKRQLEALLRALCDLEEVN